MKHVVRPRRGKEKQGVFTLHLRVKRASAYLFEPQKGFKDPLLGVQISDSTPVEEDKR
jgi:hypothetical protein